MTFLRPKTLLAAFAAVLALSGATDAHAKGKAAKGKLVLEETPEPPPAPPEEGDDEKPKDDDEKPNSDEADADAKDTGEVHDESTEEAVTEEVPPPAAKPAARFARFWFGVAGTFEVAFLPRGSDLCRLGSNNAPANTIHAYCTDPSGRDFPVRASFQNQFLVPGYAGKMDGRPQLGDARVLLALDYALDANMLLGARAGWVFHSYPGHAGLGGRPAVTRHLHGELRFMYLFGDAPLAKVGFAPLALFALGAGQFDATRRTTVRFQGIAAAEPTEIWIVSGPWFAALGGGARYQFSQRAALTAAARLNVSFGPLGSLLSAGPELGFAYGF